MGKTSTGSAYCSRVEKHPHLRGENGTATGNSFDNIETSPPAWGKPRNRAALSRSPQKHPHLRGENSIATEFKLIGIETSPPAWGKPSIDVLLLRNCGNIPTCVGKTARCCLDCHSGYYILLKSKFLALSLRQGCAIFAYYPSLGIDLRLAEAQRDVPNDCGGRVIKGRLLPN